MSIVLRIPGPGCAFSADARQCGVARSAGEVPPRSEPAPSCGCGPQRAAPAYNVQRPTGLRGAVRLPPPARISFTTSLHSPAVDAMKTGGFVALSNARVDMFRSSMRLVVDQRGSVDPAPDASFQPKVCVSVSVRVRVWVGLSVEPKVCVSVRVRVRIRVVVGRRARARRWRPAEGPSPSNSRSRARITKVSSLAWLMMVAGSFSVTDCPAYNGSVVMRDSPQKHSRQPGV